MTASSRSPATAATCPRLGRHLRVLREHGLIDEQRPQGDGRGRVYRLRPGSLDPLAGWPVVRQSIEVTFGPGVHLQAEAAGRPRG